MLWSFANVNLTPERGGQQEEKRSSYCYFIRHCHRHESSVLLLSVLLLVLSSLLFVRVVFSCSCSFGSRLWCRYSCSCNCHFWHWSHGRSSYHNGDFVLQRMWPWFSEMFILTGIVFQCLDIRWNPFDSDDEKCALTKTLQKKKKKAKISWKKPGNSVFCDIFCQKNFVSLADLDY